MIVDVGAVDEFPEGDPVIITVGGREVFIVSWEGDWFALRNVCPHQTEILGTGCVIRDIAGDQAVGMFKATQRPLIACPRHVWTFDLRTGQCTVDPRLRVRAYDVTVNGGRVLLDDGRADGAAEPTPVVGAPSSE